MLGLSWSGHHTPGHVDLLHRWYIDVRCHSLVLPASSTLVIKVRQNGTAKCPRAGRGLHAHIYMEKWAWKVLIQNFNISVCLEAEINTLLFLVHVGDHRFQHIKVEN